MAEKYVRQHVEGFIIKALQSLGGSASKNTIKEEIVADDSIDITYSNVFEPILSKNGEPYIPFNLDFGFGLINLHTCGYIDDYVRRGDITLTEKGRTAVYSDIPTDEDKTIIKQYWDKKDKERLARDRNKKISEDTHDNTDSDKLIEIPSEKDSDTEDDWRVEVLEQIKQFSPKKFESFSRLLLSNMGIKFDHEKGVKMSSDHGIDGYGYYESDEFRTARVVIQCKRYTDNAVSEPEIDKFKGVMMSFNADYGIFITTSYFTKQAQSKAIQGSNTVTLIDGQRLVDLIEKYQLHITPVNTYVLNDYYYQKD